MAEISLEQWDTCANPGTDSRGNDLPYDPFVSHVFLNALEESKSAVAETGWAPHHLILESRDSRLLGAVPMYIKNHSRGEYVFDYQWSDAFERAGNGGYRNFDDFLGALSAKKRRNIIRERRIALESGIQIEHLTGSKITESHWDAFFRFYMDTGNRKWGTPYLTRRFFSMVGASMADRILLVMCRLGDHYVAGALNFLGGDCLYGRYWGTLGDFPFLHFEVCYYQAIEYAIRHKLAFVEAGAQGEHKLARGYLPHQTYSAHWIANDSFRAAIADYLISERRYVAENIQIWHEHSPFRSKASKT